MRDPLAAQVTSLIRFNGANASTTFTDDTGRVWTAQGNAQLSTTTPRTGSACGLFDGAGDAISSPASTGLTFAGDFSLEVDVRIPGTKSGSSLIFINTTDALSSGGMTLYIPSGTRQLRVFSYVSNADVLSSSINLTDNVYSRVEVSRQGSTLRMFVEGALAASATNTETFACTRLFIGTNENLASSFNGRLDNFRVTNGTARNTAAYTVNASEYPSL